MKTFDRVRRVLVEECDVDPDLVALETPIVHLNIDSMEIAYLVLELEQEFAIDVPDDDFQKFRTIGDIVAYAEARA